MPRDHLFGGAGLSGNVFYGAGDVRSRHHFLLPSSVMRGSQRGAGFFSSVRNAIKKIKRVGAKVGTAASNIYAGRVGTKLRNQIPDSDANARPQYPGEKHAILRLSNGKFGTANYMGPGTKIIKRLKRKDPPRTQSDKVAQAHDIRYSLDPDNGRKWDNKMISTLNRIAKNKGDSQLNISLGKRGIQAKIAAEKAGILDPTTFTHAGGPLSAGDRRVLTEKLNMLEQEGFGVEKWFPGARLKEILKTKRKKAPVKTPGVFSAPVKTPAPKRRCTVGKGVSFPRPSTTGGGVQFQRGRQRGRGDREKALLLVKAVSNLVKATGLTKSSFENSLGSTIGTLIKRLVQSSNTKSQLVDKTSKMVSAVLLKSAMKELGLPKKMMQTGTGQAIPSHQVQLQKKIKTGLNKILAPQSGTGMSGGGFWGSVGNFFKKVAQVVLIPIATAVVEAGTLGAATPFVMPAAIAAEAALVAS